MSFRTLSAILRGRWLIDKQWAESQMPLVLSLLNGVSADVPRSGNELTESPFVINPQTMQRCEMYVDTPYGRKANSNIPDGSVAILPVTGPILKYNGDCGEPGSLQRVSWLMDIQKRDSISGVIMLVDSPGGQVDGTQSFANAVKSFNKPLIGLVDDGMAASAAMWVISAADEVYATLESDQVGSIGVYTTIMDFQGYLEKNGVKMHEVYAPQSTEKNKPYRDAVAGNYDLLLADLQATADTFISAVKKNRGSKAVANADVWSKGAMFSAVQAKEIGLIDGIISFEKAINRVAYLANKKK